MKTFYGILLLSVFLGMSAFAINDPVKKPHWNPGHKYPPLPGERRLGFIEFDNQVFRESVPVAGTPYHINYSSWGVPGNRQAYTLNIPLYDPNDGSDVISVSLRIQVTNRVFSYSQAEPSTNFYTFEWDGKDAASNTVTGTLDLLYEVTITTLENSYGSMAPSPPETEHRYVWRGSSGRTPTEAPRKNIIAAATLRNSDSRKVPNAPVTSYWRTGMKHIDGFVNRLKVQAGAMMMSPLVPDRIMVQVGQIDNYDIDRGGWRDGNSGERGQNPATDSGPPHWSNSDGTSDGGTDAEVGTEDRQPFPYTSTETLKAKIGTMMASQYGLGGWTLSPHHFYDPRGHVLYTGSGDIRNAEPIKTPACTFTDSASTGTNDISIVSEEGDELFVFNSQGRHLRTLDSYLGVTNVSFTYDTNGYLSTVTDVDGVQTVVERNGQGLPTAIISPYGLRTTLQLDTNNYLTAVVNPENETNGFRYTSGGLLTNVITRRGYIYAVAYDAVGAVIRADHPSSGFETLFKTLTYNPVDITHVDLMQRTNLYRWTYLAGNFNSLQHTSPDGAASTTISDYDNTVVTNILSNGTIISSVSGPDPRFDLQVPQVESYMVKLPSGLAMTVTVSRAAALSDTGNVLSLVSLTNKIAVNNKTNVTIYTASSRSMQVTSPEGRSYTIHFDAKGRMDKVDSPGFFAIEAGYDSHGRLQSIAQATGAIKRMTALGFSTNGYIEKVTNGLTQVTALQNDNVGRVTNAIRPDSQAISLLYDDSDNLTGVTPPGRSRHSIGYTSVSLMDRYSAPYVGVETNMLLTWNVAQQLTSVRYPEGLVVTNDFASSGLLTNIAWPENKLAVSYFSSAQIASVALTSGITLSYGYDGGLVTNVAWAGSLTGSVAYSYNNDLQLKQLAVNGTNLAQYSYDRDGLLTNAGAIALRRNNPNGLLTNTVLGNATDARTFNGFAQMSGYSSSYGTTNLLSFDYGYDQLGRITSRTERVLNVTNVYEYSYDTVGRLSQVKTNGSVYSIYQYDANGNRTNATVAGTASVGNYDAQDRMMTNGTVTYQYNASGTLTNKNAAGQVTRYRYDTLGNLLSVVLPGGTTVDYLVDGFGRRISKRVNGAMTRGFIYVNQLKPIAEVDGRTNVVATFVYGAHPYVPDYLVRSGTTYRIISDHLGSVRLVVNATNGAVAQRLDYDEFGKVVQDTNPGFQPFGFSGGLYDPDTGLIRFGCRDYDAATGRWLSKDPVLFKGGQANFYIYCDGDPINWIDPSGLGDKAWQWFKDEIWWYVPKTWDDFINDPGWEALPYAIGVAGSASEAIIALENIGKIRIAGRPLETLIDTHEIKGKRNLGPITHLNIPWKGGTIHVPLNPMHWFGD